MAQQVGTFERIRQITPYAFGFFAVTLVLFFTIGDQTVVDGIMGTQQRGPDAAIAEVESEAITWAEFDEVFRQQEQQQRTAAEQQGTEAEINYMQMRRDVFTRLIEDHLLMIEARKAGIFMSNKELAYEIRNNPPDAYKQFFSDTAGNFKRQVYLELVNNPDNIVDYMFQDPSQVPQEQLTDAIQKFRNDLKTLEEYMKSQKISQYLQSTVSASIAVISPSFAREKYITENSEVDFDYVQLKISDIPVEDIKVTDEEIREYYDKNKKYFKQEPQRKIKYISIPIAPSSEDTAKIEKRVSLISQELQKGQTPEERDSIFDIKFNEYAGETVDYTLIKDVEQNLLTIIGSMQPREVAGPLKLRDGYYFIRLDSTHSGEEMVVQASHILINFNNNKDSALAEAYRIYALAKSGEDFATLARQYSKDPGSGRNGGDLGYFGKGKMVKPFEEAAFAAEIGEITKPVESNFGYHIIKVTDKKSDEVMYSKIVLTPKISQGTTQKLMLDSKNFKSQLDKGEPFDSIASKLGYSPVETAFFDKSRPILGSQYLTDLAFEGEMGTVFEPMELKNYGYIVAMVSDARQAGIVPLEDKKPDIEAKIVMRKQLDKLKEQAESIYNKAKNSSLAAVGAGNPEINVLPGNAVKPQSTLPVIGNEPRVAAALMKAPLNKVVEPIRGEKGYFIIQVSRRNVPPDEKIQKELPEYMKQLGMTAASRAYYMWFNNQKKEADIEDNRKDFFTEY